MMNRNTPFKDNFSRQSKSYAKFRPTYPAALFSYLLQLCNKTDYMWDCATGNGQIAVPLSDYFKQIYATDISQNQLAHAPQATNIEYSVQSAEHTNFPDNIFDLITVAQAIHWFDFSGFYDQVKRTIKSGGILAIIGSGRLKLFPEGDRIIDRLFNDFIGDYRDPELKYLDHQYQTIPFPFTDIEHPDFVNTVEWTFDQLIGYLNTWSVVQHYEKAHQKNPITLIADQLREAWGVPLIRTVSFPIILRVARIHK
ncbi:class I SAM-dependent methyltransferase [Pedobacter sp. MR2016-24]|uniref:class I SAM-dependent methyltransferase n=1 Tax=Pedobacter sp. MR2016-24 TaxID=2994466 RepID=UPI002247198E|nr:class I SAM-dependent methyltransferase [Pedobacter sp. MR2016-24]MCX2484827.1 class I SAM-dependent methyltransferase [Pedobacter sp. MR2016-24]